MKGNKLVIIGLGSIGLILLRSLPKEYDVVCVDKDEEALVKVKELREDIEIVHGDATSRLVLEETPVDEADCVIITTRDEKVNIEVSRLLHEHFEPKRVIAIGMSESGIRELESMGVEVENIFEDSAIGILNRLQKTRTTHEIGLGKNEIMEVEVHPNSRLANKPIGIIAPIKWRLGLIYRDGNIIVPRKDTILKPRDRVVILGDPNVLKTVAEILTFSFERFPLEYGSVILTYLKGSEDESFFEELGYIISSFPIEKNIFICTKKSMERREEIEDLCERHHIKQRTFKESVLPLVGAVEETVNEINSEQGLLILSKDVVVEPRFPLLFQGRKSLYTLVDLVSCPVFLLSGTHPYHKILLPCFIETDVERIIETGIEISYIINSSLTAITLEPSRYITTEEEQKRYTEIKKQITSLTSMYKTSVQILTKRGNPIKVTHMLQNEYNLAIINRGTSRKGVLSFLFPDVIWRIITGMKITTLIIPPMEETL